MILKICTYDYGLAQLFLWSEVLHTLLKSVHKVLRHFFLQTNQLYWILKRILSSNKCIMHKHKFNEVRLRQNVTSDKILQFLACSCISIIQVVIKKLSLLKGQIQYDRSYYFLASKPDSYHIIFRYYKFHPRCKIQKVKTKNKK